MREYRATKIMLLASGGWFASMCAGVRVGITKSYGAGLLVTLAGFTGAAAIDAICLGLAVRRQ